MSSLAYLIQIKVHEQIEQIRVGDKINSIISIQIWER